ncbi:partial Diacetylchitobiose uptake system permease protein NgcG, partial [Anaerolineae bacterium]
MNFKQYSPYRNWGTYAVLAVLSAIVLFPLIITVSQSFMTNQEVNRWPPKILPTAPTVESYNTVLTQQDVRLDLWLRNSLLAAGGYTLAVLVICTPAAYAFARLRFPGNRLLFAILLVTIMIPGQVTLIPNFLLMRDLKWLDTFNALIFPGAANVFGVFLLRQFF